MNAPAPAPLTGVILAGGKSSRMGRDKVQLALRPGGPTLLEAAVGLISRLCDEVLVISGPAAMPVPAPARAVPDLLPGQGPLVGIYTGLLSARHDFALVVACDMPFLNRELLLYMAALPRRYDVLLIRTDDHHEPLHAIYSKSCLPHIEAFVREGGRKIDRFYPRVRVVYVDDAEVRRLDPEMLSTRNLNTPEDFERARRGAADSSLPREPGANSLPGPGGIG